MNKIIRTIGIIIVIALIVTVANGFYFLEEGKQAVITQFGRPVGQPVTEAGLHFKTPYIQEATFFEKKILIWDGDPNQIPTNDKTFVYLDVTARWRITDALVFLQAVNNETRAQTILDDIIDGTVRDLVNKNDLVEIIRSSDFSPETMTNSAVEFETLKYGRDNISAMIHETASKITPKYGIELVDVLFKRVNYIETVRLKVYDRMISERKRIAAEKRSQGEGQKAEIMGKVEKELKVILSTANREAEEIKGKADAEAAKIYADAYNQDPEFYSFTKSLESYKTAVGQNTNLVISSDSEFYKFLQKLK
ncbi:MAG: protease modulator HflC [Desulfobulbaceae bacterium]|nr:protease modulator HflC [Desulfobulbaceae bacterium]HKJ15145.1 protease modulator HflC [Desulfobulbales bacterium]MDH3542527.1 protease modulator HflC [Desulfobulbaceae bacterium]MDH3781342.1 protease modulator HflC [Desulfobulbaceae bacterium]MDH3866194.1 protease modulator HflC [Desulfobulbaceae bacterium]